MKKSVGTLTVDSVKENSFKPELDQAMLRQEVTISYTKRNVSDSVFDEADFNLPSSDFTKKRVAWIPVPKGTTKEQVVEKLKAYPTGCIQRILSLKPILSADDKRAIENKITTLEKIGSSQIVRDTDAVVVDYEGKTQYAKNVYSKTEVADIDTRAAELVAILNNADAAPAKREIIHSEVDERTAVTA